MPREARDHEPLVALDGGSDGVDVQRRIIAEAPGWLRAGGSLLIETGREQSVITAGEMRAVGLAVEVVVDDERDATVVIGTARGPLVNRRQWRHNGAMTSVQIKDVPEETHRVLRRRAAEAHQSLQEYLRSRLIEEASRPTVAEVLERAGERGGGNSRLRHRREAVRADRDRR